MDFECGVIESTRVAPMPTGMETLVDTTVETNEPGPSGTQGNPKQIDARLSLFLHILRITATIGTFQGLWSQARLGVFVTDSVSSTSEGHPRPGRSETAAASGPGQFLPVETEECTDELPIAVLP